MVFPCLSKIYCLAPKWSLATKKSITLTKPVTPIKSFFKRVNRLANVLKGLNLQKGDVVAVMDWDTHRYLECYFAIPMCGYI
ncbi:AMP-binding protein, partial [Xanthomonas citri pv. citri]